MITVELDLKQYKEIIIEEIDGKKEVYYDLYGEIYPVQQINAIRPRDGSQVRKNLDDEISVFHDHYLLCLKGSGDEHEHVTLKSTLAITREEKDRAREEEDARFRQVDDSSWKQ